MIVLRRLGHQRRDPSLDVALQQTLDDWFGTGDIGGAVAAIGLADGTVNV